MAGALIFKYRHMSKMVEVKYSLGDKVKRVLWSMIYNLLVRPWPRRSMRRLHIVLLRLFGAKVDSTAVIYSSAKVLIPWNLVMEAHSTLADRVYVENSTMVHLKTYSIVSQDCYLCTGSHDIWTKKFTAKSAPITIGERAWVAARSFIYPGVKIGDGAVVSAASVVMRNVKPWKIVSGNPAQEIGEREIEDLND